MESGEFEFPVDVCQGCLIAYGNNIDPTCPTVPNCGIFAKAAASNTSTSSSMTVQEPCIFGQDLAVSCTL